MQEGNKQLEAQFLVKVSRTKYDIGPLKRMQFHQGYATAKY